MRRQRRSTQNLEGRYKLVALSGHNGHCLFRTPDTLLLEFRVYNGRVRVFTIREIMMNQEPKPSLSVPRWYWVIAIVALLWNLMGCMAFVAELVAQEAFMESWTDEQKEWARSIPTWIYFVYGIAVSTGVAACVGLLMRKGWSVTLFAISLVAVVIQMVYTTFIAGGLKVMGAEALIMPSLVIVFGAALLWFARHAKPKWFKQ